MILQLLSFKHRPTYSARLRRTPTDRRDDLLWLLQRCALQATRHALKCIQRQVLPNTSSSAMAEKPRELDQRFQIGGQFEAIIDLSYFFAPLRHDAIYACASYGKQTISSTRPSCWIQISTPSTVMREQHCGRPSDVYNTDRPTKLTALETISRWLILKSKKNRSLSHPLGHLGVTYALHLWLVGKPIVDVIFIVIELFSISPTVETL